MSLASLIDDARVLLEELQRSPYRSLHVRTAAGTIFLAKPGGARPPVRGVQLAVTAPHLGSVVSTLAAGARVEAGASIGTLSVLDATFDVLAPRAGIVADVCVLPGALVEYETPLVMLAV